MSKVIHRVLFDTHNYYNQWLATGGGRVVKVMPYEHVDHLVELYFEVDRDFFNRGEDLDRAFILVSTGQVVPDGYEFVGTAHMTADEVVHIYQQISEAKDKPKQDVLSEYGQATTLSYNVSLYKNRDLVMVAQVSATGALDLLEKYTEPGSTTQTRAEFMQILQASGSAETIGHMVDGQLYSMKFSKNEGA